MAERQDIPSQRSVVDITELATLGELFLPRLMELGFRLFQVIDAAGHDQHRYVAPPVCAVPDGLFLMGSDKQNDSQAQDYEMSQEEMSVSAFQIGTYPVTVAEYLCAVEAGALAAPKGRPQQLDHPVVCITWFEAMAYVAWFAQVTGQAWRLPTEAEWEKAARGTDGRIYPWGNQWDERRANTSQSSLNTTTPVGSYMGQEDTSPYGTHDMAGNVWEWTSSIVQQPPYRNEQAADITLPHVLHGGSWCSLPLYARAACHNRIPPTFYDYDIGVRLVVSAAAGTR